MKIQHLILIISFFLNICFCEDIKLNELAKFKTEVLGQYETLKANYKKLSEENQKLKHKNNVLQDNLDESQDQNANLTDELKTLRHKSFSLNGSKEYDLYPDVKSQLPIRAVFEFSGRTTKIGQTLEFDITHCNTSKCFTHDIHYEPQIMELIKTFIEGSSECHQEITFHCHITPLVAPVRSFG